MKQPAKTVPIGPALNDDDTELDMLALITREDIEAAKADARAKMTKRGMALLEAARATDAADVSMAAIPSD